MTFLANFLSRMLVLSLSWYGLAACTSQPPEIPQLKYDGQYNVLFTSENSYRASANFAVKQHRLKGQVINTENQSFEIEGHVLDSGRLELIHVQTSLQVAIQANGQIADDGTLEGVYRVGTRQGEFKGFRYTETDLRTPKYDGTYQISFYRGGREMASTIFTIHYGFFPVRMLTDQGSFVFEGLVMGDGQLILPTMISNQGRGIAASGRITPQFTVEGIYYTADGQKGEFMGQALSLGNP